MGEFDTLSINEPYPHVDQKVQSIFVHPGYNHDETTTKGYDIALIKLADPVDYAINQVPICLPQNNDTLVGEIAWVKGFGRLSDGNYLKNFNLEMLLLFICNFSFKNAFLEIPTSKKVV